MAWEDIKNFRPEEFASPDAPESGRSGMNMAFVRKLDSLRMNVGSPLTIQSGYRTPAHNMTVGGVDSSAHETGHAADIRAIDPVTRFRIVQAAMRMGFRRIGVGTTFIHIDDDPMKPQDVFWLYGAAATRGNQ